MSFSIAMTDEVDVALRGQLLRADGQEDVAIATFTVSTGAHRTTAVLRRVLLPGPGERLVHGSASFTSAYVVRAAAEARDRGEGVVVLHSHPRGRDWQGLSSTDFDTEADYRRVAEKFTGLPLVGMTLAGDGSWSARLWDGGDDPVWAESVRCASTVFRAAFNPDIRPAPVAQPSQVRTVSAWGERTQASLARLRVLVVGVGSVGLDVCQRLAATGVLELGVMDFDEVEVLNLDRMVGATRLDARLGRAKVEVAARLARSAATAPGFTMVTHELSITDPDGLAAALDYDIIISCVDRPWPRAVLNTVAYSDLIPVIDGGIGLDTFPDGRLRSGMWRSHTVLPGRPCLVCIGQVPMNELSLDRRDLLDDPEYIKGSGGSMPAKQNVAALSASVSADLLSQFVSLVAHPGGRGVPAALTFILATHDVIHSSAKSAPFCPFEADIAAGDGRPMLTERQQGWRDVVAGRRNRRVPFRWRLLDVVQRWLDTRAS